jgi:ppGpp synthetase/RelA/SpoT-type nucleotidyltranferase
MVQEHKETLVSEFGHQRNAFESFRSNAETLVWQLLRSARIVPHDVESRVKDPDSLRAKLELHPEYESLDSLPDLCGLRVILYYPSEVDIVANLLGSEFEVIDRQDHGAKVPDVFGYSSVHLVCKVSEARKSLPEWSPFKDLHFEVQIRTVLQHAWAAISHRLAYKSDEEIPADTGRLLYRVAALLETGDELFDSFRARVEHIRSEYEEKSATDQWRELPIDLDSITEAWDAMWPKAILEKIKSFGFQMADDELANRVFKHNLSSLTDACRQIGISTLGDLRDIASTGLEEYAKMKEMALVVPQAGQIYSWTTASIVRLAVVMARPVYVRTVKFAEPVSTRLSQLFGIGPDQAGGGSQGELKT